MEQYKNEPVKNEREDKENVYFLYSFLIKAEENVQDIKTLREGRFIQKVDKALQEGKADYLSEAVDFVKKELEGAVYKGLADSPEEAMEALKGVLEPSGRHYLDTREESFCRAFLPYVEGVLLAGLRAGILPLSWWRLVNYGFSVEPFDKEGKEVAFPYRSVSDMKKKKDRDAFRLLVEDYYSELETTGSWYHARGGRREGEEDYSFRPYPKDGFTAEEIASQNSTKDEPIDVDALYESWEWELELFLPFLIFRFEESLYYALKYPGDEYKRHIESLNVREDWDGNYGETDYSYGQIFGEEA